MGATNSTIHYNLSQFNSTDKPAWLQDYNGDMQKIDTGINGALVAAESAQNSADTANTGVGAVRDAVISLQTTVAGHTIDITDLSGDVNTIEALIGNGTPTTTDRTIVGAINEINAKVTAPDKNNLDNEVDISTYMSDYYTIPDDGYVSVYTSSTTGTINQLAIAGANEANMFLLRAESVNSQQGHNSCFVRKGMKVKFAFVSGGSGGAKYYKLV